MPQARKDADRLEMTLHAHQVEPAQELILVRTDLDTLALRGGAKLQGPPANALHRPRDVAITQQRDEVVCHRPAHRVLKVEDARVGTVASAVADHEITRVIVAMNEHG